MPTFKERFNKKFNQSKDKSNSTADMVKLTGIPKRVLDDVRDRGVGAYKTAGASRPNMTKESWAVARQYAFIMKSYDAVKKGDGKINQDKDLYEKIKNKLK